MYTQVVAGCFEATSPKPRTTQIDADRPRIRAKYDAATDSNETKNLWSATDCLDADSSNSLSVRTKLRNRSRNERANNGHCAGVIRTHANYIVGTGPKLRIQTGATGFNTMVEAAWTRWCLATGFNRKLRTMCRAKTGDGEAFAILTDNPKVADRVKLDVRLIECDQVSSPLQKAQIERYVDGIYYDEYGNPESYDVLSRHPGSSWYISRALESTNYPARFVCHWFGGDERPGQHRGIPELTPSLNLFGTGRRYREAVVAAAETAADFSVMVQMGTASDGPDEVDPFLTLPINKRTMTIMPSGAVANQMKAEQPTTTYDSFNRNMLCEEARPLNMPYNIAACDSSGYSYSGGQLDHLTYFVSIDVERQDCETSVLEKVFALWFEEAVRAYGWSVSDNPAPKHAWDWCGKPQTDPEKTANSRKTRLSCGDIAPSECAAEDGVDFEDRCIALANDYGKTVEEIKEKLFESNFQKSGGAPEPKKKEPDSSDNKTQTPPANGRANGHSHTNRIAEYV